MNPISLNGLTVYPYGMAVALISALMLIWSSLRCQKAGIRRGVLSWFALMAVPLGLVCARLGYVLSESDYYCSEDLTFFLSGLTDLSSGGFMRYTALGGGLLALWITAGACKVPFGKLTDAIAVPAAVLVACCDLAEGMTGGGYGWGLEDWFGEGNGYSIFVLDNSAFFCRFPFAVSDYYGEWKWAVFVLMGLLSGLTAFLVAKARVRRLGGCCVLFLLMHAASRILCDSMRQDAISRWGFVRVNQVVGAAVIVLLLILCWCRSHCNVRLGIRSAVLTLLCLLVITAMEFAMEGKISAIEWLPMDGCYLLTTLACVGTILSVLPLWRRAYGCMAER